MKKASAIFTFFILCILSGCVFVSPQTGDVSEDSSQTPAPVIFSPASSSESDEPGSDSFEAQLVISEVLPNASGDEYVELFNISAETVFLNEYYLSNTDSFLKMWRLPNVELPPGERYVIYFSQRADSSDKDSTSFPSFSLNNLAHIYLADESSHICTYISWDRNIAEEIAVIKTGVYTAFPTPGKENSPYITQTCTVCEGTGSLILAEAMRGSRFASFQNTVLNSPWVEIENTSSEPEELGIWFLSENPEKPFKFRLPEYLLAPGERSVILLDNETEGQSALIHTSFKLSAEEDSLFLTNGLTMKTYKLILPADLPRDISVGRGKEGQTVYFGCPTPGVKNAAGFSDASEAEKQTPAIIINEVFAGGVYRDNTPDWIELHNTTRKKISLDGWFLSEENENKTKWKLSGVSVPAGGYAVLYLTEDGKKEGARPGAFSLGRTGETVFLTNADGVLTDVYETGVLRPGCSSGYSSDSNDKKRYFYTDPTPGEKNGAGAAGYSAVPVLSVTDLYASEPFLLTLSCADAEAEIRYTLNGSEPQENSTLYTEPLMLSKNTAICVKTFREGMLPRETVTASYLFEKAHTVTVFCMVGEKSGIDRIIATGYSERDKKPEFMVYFNYYETSGSMASAFPAGIRAKGRSMLKYTHKSFSVHLRESYGKGEFAAKLFEDSERFVYSSFSLRGGGQDRGKARLRDSYFQKVAAGLHIDTVKTRVAVLYINGNYYGVFDLNEEQDADYLAYYNGADPDTVDIVRRNDDALTGTADDFLSVRSFAREADFSDNANFEKLAKMIDVDYFTDYLIFQSYFSNTDMFNQKYWHSADGMVRWRPFLFDLDYCLQSDNYDKNVLASYFFKNGVPSANGTQTNTDIYCALRQNPEWCVKFAKRYIELVYTAFAPERLHALLDEVIKPYLAEMPKHFEAFKTGNMYNMEKHIQALHSNIDARPALAIKYLQKVFSFSDSQIEEWSKPYLNGKQGGTE